MLNIHTTFARAAECANTLARTLSLKHGECVAVVTSDRYGSYLAWATVPQDLAVNETQVGVWRHGKRTHNPVGGNK